MAFLQPSFTNGTVSTANYQSSPFVSGYNLTQSSTTKFTLSAGTARSLATDFVIQYPPTMPQQPSTITVDITTVGAGGVYPVLASLAAPTYNTVFGVYAIGNSSGLVNIPYQQTQFTSAVVATGNNFLPSGYDSWFRVGSIYTNAGADTMILMNQSGSGLVRKYQLQEAVLLTNALQTSYTAINLQSATAGFPINPNFVTKLMLLVEYTPNSASNILSLESANATPTNAPIEVKTNGTAQVIQNVEMLPGFDASGNMSIWYKAASSDALAIYLVGWEESGGLQAI